MEEVQTQEAEVEVKAPPAESNICLNDIKDKLAERVSGFDAKLLLNSVVVGSGLSHDRVDNLNVDEAKTICLELIKKGGPAFKVGRDLYNHI